MLIARSRCNCPYRATGPNENCHAASPEFIIGIRLIRLQEIGPRCADDQGPFVMRSADVKGNGRARGDVPNQIQDAALSEQIRPLTGSLANHLRSAATKQNDVVKTVLYLHFRSGSDRLQPIDANKFNVELFSTPP